MRWITSKLMKNLKPEWFGSEFTNMEPSEQEMLNSFCMDKQIDPEKFTYKVKIVSEGNVVLSVFIPEYELAIEFARVELENREDWNPNLKHAALIESGKAFVPFSFSEDKKSYWYYDGSLREGVVLNTATLNECDPQWLFGMRKNGIQD